MIKKIVTALESGAQKEKRNNNYFMKHAELAATMSYCKRSQVGAVIVKNNRVICEGRNGTLKGSDNCCEENENSTKQEVVHAEINALSFSARSGIATDGCIMYCTLTPCVECAKAIIQSGITKVYYKDTYRDSSGLELLKKHINVEEWK